MTGLPKKVDDKVTPLSNQLYQGDCLETLKTLPGPFDFVLLDVSKDLYLPCFELLHPKLAPGAIYANGLGTFLGELGIPMSLGYSFGLLAFTTFVYDTLDVCTRLGRYVLQEMTGLRGLAGGAAATGLTLAGPSLYLWTMPPGSFCHGPP